LHPPKLQPEKLEPAAGVTVKLTCEIRSEKPNVHPWVEPEEQSMPGGVLTTLPFPSPATFTVSTLARVNDVVASRGASSVSMHGPFAEQPPVQPSKLAMLDASAVSVTIVPVGNIAKHGPPPMFEQLMPGGELVTVPGPLPITLTVSGWVPPPVPPLPPVPPVIVPDPPAPIVVGLPVVEVGPVGVPPGPVGPDCWPESLPPEQAKSAKPRMQMTVRAISPSTIPNIRRRSMVLKGFSREAPTVREVGPLPTPTAPSIN